MEQNFDFDIQEEFPLFPDLEQYLLNPEIPIDGDGKYHSFYIFRGSF